MVAGRTSILCETFDGLMIILRTTGRDRAAIASNGWVAYAWDADGRTIFGLRPTDDLHHFMLVVVDVQTERAASAEPEAWADSTGESADSRLQPAAERRIPDLDRPRPIRHLPDGRLPGESALVGRVVAVRT